MDNITNQTPSISDTTYNVASDATAAIDPLMGNVEHGHTEFTSSDQVGEIPGAKHPIYKSGKIVNDVISYFERPCVVKQGSIPNASYGLISGNSNYNVTSNTFNASYTNNMSGCIGLRFTLCLKLEIAALPQACGIFKLGVVPFNTITGSTSPITLAPQYAQFPSAEVNIADCSSVTLKYPFNWDRDFLSSASTDVYAQVGVVAYTPFTSNVNAGLSSTYTIYQWFEDVELVGPGTVVTTTVVPQMGDKQEFQVAGPVSKVMSYASKINKAVGAYIPTLSVYTRPLGWVFSGIGTLASHFGWSKPNNCNADYMLATVGAGVNCVTGVGKANELGMYANNEVKCEPFFASKDFDEMSICYLTCIPCPIATILLNGATDVYGTCKWICPVSPSYFWYQGRGNYVQKNMGGYSTGAVIPSTLMGCAQFFSGWRGDLIFRFKFARSKFIGGKVLIGYNPSPNVAAGSIPAISRRYDYETIVVDLRTTTVADLSVPFTYNTDVAPTNFLKAADSSYTTYNTGNVFMYVIEPIISTDATATSIYAQVEVFSECGIQFANTIATPLALAPNVAPLIAQMGVSEDRSVLERTCGEAIMSLKQLAMRPQWGLIGFAKEIPDNDWSTAKYATNLSVLPSMTWVAPGGNLTQLAAWYRFYRGSVVHYVYPTGPNNASEIRWASLDGILGGSPLSAENKIINSVRRPFYSYHNRVLVAGVANTTQEDVRLLRVDTTVVGAGNEFYYAVTAGDDFQYGCFVCVPLLVSVAANVNSPYPPA